MTNKQALLKSIKKWEKVAFKGVYGAYWKDCACCTNKEAFRKKSCKGCPINSATGAKSCRKTPYSEYVDAAKFGGTNVEDAAILEYLFLCDLYNEYYA